MNLVNVLKSAALGYGTERRVLLLHGPVGSSKSTIARLLKKGLEHYSQTDDGRRSSPSTGARSRPMARCAGSPARCTRSRCGWSRQEHPRRAPGRAERTCRTGDFHIAVTGTCVRFAVRCSTNASPATTATGRACWRT